MPQPSGTREVAMRAVRELSAEQLAATRSPGTLINSNHHPGLAECIGNPRALDALDVMGFGGSRFWKAVIISKPAPSPRLYWHQDCMWWDDPPAYSDYSPMIFLMYYLDDTSRENGRLRLLPQFRGSTTAFPRQGVGSPNPDRPRLEPARSHSGEDQPPLRLWDLSAELLGGVDPLPDNHLYVVQSLLVGAAVGGTARQLRDFGDERIIFPAPVDDDLILDHVYPPKRTSG